MAANNEKYAAQLLDKLIELEKKIYPEKIQSFSRKVVLIIEPEEAQAELI